MTNEQKYLERITDKGNYEIKYNNPEIGEPFYYIEMTDGTLVGDGYKTFETHDLANEYLENMISYYKNGKHKQYGIGFE